MGRAGTRKTQKRKLMYNTLTGLSRVDRIKSAKDVNRSAADQAALVLFGRYGCRSYFFLSSGGWGSAARKREGWAVLTRPTEGKKDATR